MEDLVEVGKKGGPLWEEGVGSLAAQEEAVGLIGFVVVVVTAIETEDEPEALGPVEVEWRHLLG